MGLNLSNDQIAEELALNSSDVHYMTTELRGGIVKKKPKVIQSDEVECDEADVVAGHNWLSEGREEKETQKAVDADSKAKRAEVPIEKERPPVFGMIQRGGQVVTTC